MLAAPAFQQIEGVTIFRDDTLFYKFYPIAQAPTVRLDKQNKPIFLLVKYAFSDEDRQHDPTLPPGGGYMNFDIQFDVTPEQLTKVRAALQPIVDAEWQRFKVGTAEEQAQPGVAGTTEAPRVEIGSPTWTGGSVKLDAPQSTQLVSARVAEGAPSLLAGNIAVFNMDLTPAGASFMQQVLVTPTGTGAGNLTPIQVGYDLKFWARLPPARIHISVDSEKVHEYLHKQMDGRGTDHCTTYDYENTDIDTMTASATGAITVQIDNAAGLPEDVVEELRNYSLDLVKQLVEKNFFEDSPSPEDDDEDDQNQPNRPSRGASDNSKKYLRQKSENEKVHIDFTLEQRSVVEWQIHPQSTLQTFFRNMPASEIAQYVREINLDDDFFKNLDLNVRAFSSFGDNLVSNVEVQVQYGAGGTAEPKRNTFTFTNDDEQNWKVGMIDGKRGYQYRYRVGYLGREAGPFTEWTDESSPDLNVAVPEPGRITLDVLAGDVDFANLVESLQVHLAYEDADQGVVREESTVLLGATKLADTYRRLIYKPQTKDLLYRTRFKLKSGDVIESADWQKHRGPQLLINQAFNDALKVGLVPAGDGWDDITQVLVELHYADAANTYTVEDTIPFKSRDEFKQWRVFLKNKLVREFKYRYTVAYKNGHLTQTEWQTERDDALVSVIVKRIGIKVSILADALDFAACPLTEITCHYNAAGVQDQETFVFRDKAPQFWNIDVAEGSPVEFTYQVTHSPAGRNQVVLPETREQDTVVVLPQYQAPRAGKITVQAFCPAIDTASVSMVALDLKYDDDPNNIHEIGALTFMAPGSQSWEVNVKDTSHRQFGYKLTYYKTDGSQPETNWTFQEVPRIVVPKVIAS